MIESTPNRGVLHQRLVQAAAAQVLFQVAIGVRIDGQLDADRPAVDFEPERGNEPNRPSENAD